MDIQTNPGTLWKETTQECIPGERGHWEPSEKLAMKSVKKGLQPFNLFEVKYYLETLMLIHSGEKPHECNLCGKLSAQNHLNGHKTLGAGEKPEECGSYRKAFRDTSTQSCDNSH